MVRRHVPPPLPALTAPERTASVVDRPFSAAPHFVALVVALALVALLLLIWAVVLASQGHGVVPWLSFGLAVALALGVAAFAASFYSAKARAIQERRREAPIFFGLARLVLWEGNEGLLFLKNKRVSDVIYGQAHGGGTAIIYPLLGEELRIHVPLTLRPCEFLDSRVLSKDGIHLQVRLTFWWRILDARGLETFYLVVDREVHKATDADEEWRIVPPPRSVDPLSRRYPEREPKSEHHAAEIWIRKIVESCTRKMVSLTTANHAIIQLTTPKADALASAGVDASDHLSLGLRRMVQAEIERYGFYVDRIDIQDVQLPPVLQSEIHRLYQAKFIPVRSELEAKERYNTIQKSLEAVRDVIGVEATAVREILSSLSNNYFFGGLPPQLELLLTPFVAALSSRPVQPPSALPGRAGAGTGLEGPPCEGDKR